MHVKNTAPIWSQVQAKITSMHAQSIADAENWFAYGLAQDEFDSIIRKEVIPADMLEVLNKYGAALFSEYDTLTVKLHGATPGREINYSLRFSPKQFMPQKWHDYYNEGKRSCHDSRIKAIVDKRFEAVSKAKTARDEFLVQTKKVFDSAGSVNAILKAWPAFADLLPAEIVQKVNKKATAADRGDRKAQEEELAAQAKGLAVGMLMAKVLA